METKIFRKKIKKTDIIIEVIFFYQIDELIKIKLFKNLKKLRQAIENNTVILLIFSAKLY